ncbi:TolC family protein [Empedobacter sp.]|uniref:TolC family protein n=1 Tax=Empedobacter sp. TaxID=1927715 RepID=UPI0028AFA135|nr:TolC family protein [Empedobacter sp.]
MKKIVYFCFILLIVSKSFAQKDSFTLDQSVNYAWENSISLKDISLQNEVSKIEIEKSKSNFLPTLAFSSSYNFQSGSIIDPATNNRNTLNIQSGNFALTTSVDLFNWQTIIRLKLSKLEKEKLKYQSEIIKQNLYIQIVQAFYQLQFNKEQEKLIEYQIQNTLIHLDRIQEEVKYGNKSESDLLEMKANLSNFNKQKVDASSNSKLAYLTLQNILNKKDSTDYIFDNEQLFDKTEDLDQLYQKGLENRPDIVQSKIDEQIAQKNIEQQKSGYLPNLGANYSFSSFYTNSNKNPFSNQINDNKSHYVGISLNFPIFNKLQTQKSIEQSKIELERSQLKTHQLEQEYYNLMSDLYLKTNNSLEQWEASEKNLKNYQLSFEKIEDKFKFGLITIYEYLNSKNNLLQIETNNLIAKYSFYLNSNMLYFYNK